MDTPQGVRGAGEGLGGCIRKDGGLGYQSGGTGGDETGQESAYFESRADGTDWGIGYECPT